jgi:hypothetical protein
MNKLCVLIFTESQHKPLRRPDIWPNFKQSLIKCLTFVVIISAFVLQIVCDWTDYPARMKTLVNIVADQVSML